MAPAHRHSTSAGRPGGVIAALALVLLCAAVAAAPAGAGPASAGTPGVHSDDGPALAFDAAGALYAADTGADRVVALDPAGAVVATIGDGALSRPAAVAIAADGDVLVADARGVHRIAAASARRAGPAFLPARPGAAAPSGAPGFGAIPLPGATAIAAAPDGSVYVAAGERVVHLDATGAQLAQWPAGEVRGIAAAADGTIWVAVTGELRRFSADGTPLGRTPADDPQAIAAGPDGTVLFAERARGRVVRAAPDGTVLGELDGRFAEPRAVALDCRGTVAVGDEPPTRIHRIAGAGAGAATPACGPAVAPETSRAAAPETANEPARPLARRPPVVQVTPRVAPVTGVSAFAEPLGGTVLVRLGGGRDVTPLRTGALLPVGARIDTRDGRVRLTFAVRTKDFPRLGTMQTADVDSGVFSFHQRRAETGVQLRLEGFRPPCRPPVRGGPVGPRHLWVDAKGDVTTRGAATSVTAGDARWLTEDRCAGTFVHVVRGTVEVRTTGRGPLRLGAGSQYVAAPGPPPTSAGRRGPGGELGFPPLRAYG